MFTANNSCSSHIEVILSMLLLYKVTPAISGLGVGWKTEKMVTCRKPFVIVIAVVTAVNGTLFPSFLRSRWRSILVGISGAPVADGRQAEPHTHIRELKGTHELIFSCVPWLAVLLMGAYA